MNKKIITITASVLSLLLLIGGVTYAFYEWVSNDNTDISFEVEGLRVRYEGGTDITGVNLIPTNTKEEGVLKEVEVELDSNQVITPAPSLSLFLDLTLFPSDLADASFKWELYKNDETTALATGDFSGKTQGDTINLISNQTVTNTKDTYKLYLWIDGSMENNSNMQGQPFTLNIRATGTNSLLAEFVDFDGVMLLANGEPCSECSLTIYSDPITTTTDTNGNYRFTNVPVGDHTIIATQNDTEVLNDTFKIRAGNDLNYEANTVTTNLNKFYMNIKATVDKKIAEVVTSNEEIVSYPFATDKIITLAGTNTSELMTINQPATLQTTANTEYRYYGATPNNYVWYNCKDIDNNGKTYGASDYTYSATNCELWRIIGVFETETPTYSGNTITGYTKENRVKIIRDESIGNYSWDSSASGVNGGYGANAWREADLMTLLNTGPYWNKTSGTCYNGENNTTTTCDFSTMGLNPIAKTLISEAKYYLGGYTTSSATTSTLYNAERGTEVKICSSGGKYCTDTADRSEPYWIGFVGLMYPSDYGYAAGSTCANGTDLGYGGYNTSCKNTDWLYNSDYQWTMTPRLNSSYAYNAFCVGSIGSAGIGRASDGRGVRPVLYLSSQVVIKDGTGSSGSPFILDR